jgi:sorting nexin-1/2
MTALLQAACRNAPRHCYAIPCHFHVPTIVNHTPHSCPPRQWIWEMKEVLRGEVSLDATTLMALSDADRNADVPSQSGPTQNASTLAPGDNQNKDNDAASTAPNAGSASTVAAAPRSPASRGPRRRQYGTQSTKLEAVDDPLGPLGAPTPPSGLETAPPAPPQKEVAASRSSRLAPDASGSSLRGLMDSVNLDDDDAEQPRAQGPRVPPPVQAPTSAAPQRQTHPSVSVEQAAKPSFNISVGDPHKVGDLTSSHTEYSVTTKTTSKGYRNSDFTVSRRYRDFLWLYTQLHNNNPGVIIPPPPDKQAVGRFEADFVESRRAALERMLNKTAAHPILQHDGDLKLFLESDAFNVDIKNKERKDPGLGESKGMFGSMLSSTTSKFVEHDDVRPVLPKRPYPWLTQCSGFMTVKSTSMPLRTS